MPVKFLVVGGSWVFLVGEGGGRADSIFMGAGIFPSALVSSPPCGSLSWPAGAPH